MSNFGLLLPGRGSQKAAGCLLSGEYSEQAGPDLKFEFLQICAGGLLPASGQQQPVAQPARDRSRLSNPAHQPCYWAGGFHAQQRLCLAPAVCISFRRRVAGPHLGQSAPHPVAARQANPFYQRGLDLRPPRYWLNINLADYYDHMQHLISQIWLNGLAKFSLSP